jgi:hypothetical protein
MMSSLWVDQRSQVTGPGLHALIIGVSDYEFLPKPNQFPDDGRETFGLTKVNIPATGAFRVAHWLKSNYWHPSVQLKTIRLLLSPSPEELSQPTTPDLPQVPATQPRAKRAEVREALLEWQKDCSGHPDGIALLYVSGHGIQWGSKDDAIVLLEDFSKDTIFLDYAIDVGKTVKGMAGSSMPQAQFYFVDACRIQPDEYPRFQNAGDPLKLSSSYTGEDLRAAPIYYGACSQTAAKGRRGKGTYFAEALTDCLELYAQRGPIRNSAMQFARQYWHVSVEGLMTSLQDHVAEIARAEQERQDVVIGGNIRSAILCARPQPPRVTVLVDIDPDAAAQVAFAELWNSDKSMLIKKRAPCWERPLAFPDVPPGLYLLELSAQVPFKTASTIAINAEPPQWKEPISLL